ncbi:MAG TPA: 2-hydroxymuconate tautomerase [Frankiaceae bacterium]|nr:2-hydroxymuconate tautomerase [Frankiaceae bacterium]
MPLVQVHLADGRTPEQKRALMDGITRVVQDTLGAPLASIRVWIDEFSPDEYMAGGELLRDKRERERR